MSYTLHQLHIFAAVAQEKSMTKAAERLQMSQPAVSIQVKKLQDHFGIELFEVIGKQLYLTEAGRELYQAQISVQQSLENAEMSTKLQKAASIEPKYGLLTNPSINPRPGTLNPRPRN